MAQQVRSRAKGRPTMHLFQRSYSYLCIIILLMACASCTDRSNISTLTGKHSKNPQASLIITTISSVSEHQGQTLVELPVGSRTGISSGSFFRVYSSDNDKLIKGTIKVDEVIDENRSLARLVGDLLDRNQPLAIDDQVKEIRDLGLLVRAAEVESLARNTIEEQAQADDAEQTQYENLRQNFQRELKNIKDLQRQDIELLQQRHQRALTRLREDNASQLKQKDLERMTDLAALQATLKRGEQKLLKSQNKSNSKKFKNIQNERNILDKQVQSLLIQQSTLQKRIQALVEEIAYTTSAHKKNMLAEIESREALEARIQSLERELAGEIVSEDIILSKDPNRNETILERLNRITQERDGSLTSGKLLRKHISELDRQIAKQHDTIQSLQKDVGSLTGNNHNQKLSLEHLQQLEKDLRASKEHLAAASLARLESERALYDLAIRIMRIPEKNSQGLEHLKDKLRAQYTTRTPRTTRAQ